MYRPNLQLLKFSFISSCCLMMTACVSTRAVIEMSQDSDYTHRMLSDQLIAVGFSKQPIPQYENALILVGQKYSYLVQNNKTDAPNYFKDLVSSLDLKYLYLSNSDKNLQQVNQQLQQHAQPQQPSWKLYSDDKGQKISATTFNSDVEFLYRKPVNTITTTEKQQLARLNFNCQIENSSTMVCKKSSTFHLTLAHKIQNTQNLQHTLRTPIQLELFQEKTNYLKKATSLTLLPLSLSFDIVTFPLQYVYCYATWGCP